MIYAQLAYKIISYYTVSNVTLTSHILYSRVSEMLYLLVTPKFDNYKLHRYNIYIIHNSI